MVAGIGWEWLKQGLGCCSGGEGTAGSRAGLGSSWMRGDAAPGVPWG